MKKIRIHIVGSGPRTGTTLLSEVMATCFEIDHYCEHEASILTDHPGDGVFLTKKPGEFLSVKHPLQFDPNLYVICIVRDPRDTVVSYHGSSPNTYWASLRFWILFIKMYRKLAIHKRFIVVQYNEFVTNPDGVQNKLMSLIPELKFKSKFSQYHLSANPSEKSIKAMRELRPIEPRGIGNWRNHLPRIKDQLIRHGSITESLILFGYEKDAGWETELNNIEPIGSSTHSGEFYPFYKRLKKHLIGYFYCIKLIVR